MIAILFEASGMNQEQYDELIKKLEAKGAGNPAGRVYHVAGPSDNGFRVVDVWNSQEEFNTFMQNDLGPIFGEMGLQPPTMSTWQVHNTIKP